MRWKLFSTSFAAALPAALCCSVCACSIILTATPSRASCRSSYSRPPRMNRDEPITQMVAKITRRALKACDSCRRQKTKCFANSNNDSGACLRCASVGRMCSFVVDNAPSNHQQVDNNNNNNNNRHHQLSSKQREDPKFTKKRKLSGLSKSAVPEDNLSPESLSSTSGGNNTNNESPTYDNLSSVNSAIADTLIVNTSKLKSIGDDVKRILEVLDSQQLQYQLNSLPLPTVLSTSFTRATSQDQHQQASSLLPSRSETPKPSIFARPILSTESGFAPSLTSPFQVIQTSVPTKYLPQTIQQLLADTQSSSLEENEPDNILSLGIISLPQTIQLVNNFKDNYEQWISLPRSLTTEELIYDLKYKCPILLTSICLTSLRYDYKKALNDDVLIRQLIGRLKVELKQNLTSHDEFKNLEFLKALVILCVYGHSISSEDLVLDPWFLSGIAIQWFLTLDRNNSFLSLRDHDNSNSLLHQLIIDEDEEEKLSNFRIWNHICLVHLVNCIFSGRQCLVDEIRLDQARRNLELPLATNFDGRMISEISLQLLLYNFIQTSSATGELTEAFESFEQELKQWHKQWNYLFDQPNLQYVEFGYHYSYVVALYHYKRGDVEFSIINHTTTAGNEDDKAIDDTHVLSKILYHSLKVLNPMLKPNSDKTLYLSCLSDQIHICLFYTCLILLKTIGWLKKFDKSNTYSSYELWNFTINVETIRMRFLKMSRNDKDLAFKYANGLKGVIEATQKDLKL